MSVTDRDAARDYLVAQAVAGHVTNDEAADWIAGDWNDADAHGNAATLLLLVSPEIQFICPHSPTFC